MPRLEYFLVAESLAIDASTNRVSIFNVLEEITAPVFPVGIPNIAAIACWLADPGDETRDFQARFIVYLPGEGIPRPFEVNFRMPTRGARTMVNVQWLPLTIAGELRFELQLNGETKAHHTVAVVQGAPAVTLQ